MTVREAIDLFRRHHTSMEAVILKLFTELCIAEIFYRALAIYSTLFFVVRIISWAIGKHFILSFGERVVSFVGGTVEALLVSIVAFILFRLFGRMKVAVP